MRPRPRPQSVPNNAPPPRVQIPPRPAFHQENAQWTSIRHTPTSTVVHSYPQHTHSKAHFRYHLPQLFHIFDNNGNKLNIDKLLRDPTTNKIWSRGLDNELGCLTQGFGNRIKGTDTMTALFKIIASQKIEKSPTPTLSVTIDPQSQNLFAYA